MGNTMLAIAAMAFATLPPLALAAEGEDDSVAEQPTMAELKTKMDGISTEIAALAATVGNLATATVGTAATSLASKVDALATTVGTLSSTVTANHTTIVGKFAPQMAVVMTVPTRSQPIGYYPAYYLVGESTIAGFAIVNGQLRFPSLPAGTYLFELQQPYSNNVLCNRGVSRPHDVSRAGGRFNPHCPRIRLNLTFGRGTTPQRLDDGFGIYTGASGVAFTVLHKFPTGFTFTDDKPLGSYSAAVKITKLKQAEA